MNKPGLLRLVLLAAVIGGVVLLIWAIWSAPMNPVALIRVVDAAGRPVAGAMVRVDGLRTKPGPYSSGHYGWAMTNQDGTPKSAVSADANGYALVEYPKYVFERIETGQISFSVKHPEFVPDRPFREVTTTPPAGAPWRVWADYLRDRMQRKALVARPDPVVVQKGATLQLSVRPDSAGPKDTPLFAQVSGGWVGDTNFWSRPATGVTVTHQLAAGTQTVRAVRFDAGELAWFSDLVSFTATVGRTNEVAVDLKPGLTVRGQLDAAVPRPVLNGRVIAHVWPLNATPANSPPQWHAWTKVGEDGGFVLGSLPAGDLEIVALCQGFVSTNGPGMFGMRYPQKYLIKTNDLSITIGMEPTARLEVLVTDDKGNPLKDARVSAWPNVRYGEWAAVILAGDCYNSADYLLSKPIPKSGGWHQPVPDFEGVSDSAGLAVVPNLPATVKEFSVEHPRFALPALVTPGGGKRRQANVRLIPGQTNQVNVQLEPRDQSPIAHY